MQICGASRAQHQGTPGRGNVARHTATTVTHALNPQAPAGTAEHLIGRIRRNLAAHRMTDICVGQMLLAAAKTLEPEAAE